MLEGRVTLEALAMMEETALAAKVLETCGSGMTLVQRGALIRMRALLNIQEGAMARLARTFEEVRQKSAQSAQLLESIMEHDRQMELSAMAMVNQLISGRQNMIA